MSKLAKFKEKAAESNICDSDYHKEGFYTVADNKTWPAGTIVYVSYNNEISAFGIGHMRPDKETGKVYRKIALIRIPDGVDVVISN
jgi:hypothetical protein